MAEMTAQFAASTLKMVADQLAARYGRFGTAEELRIVAAIIEQQAAEIVKKDRILKLAISTIACSTSCVVPNGPCPKDFADSDEACDGCWLAWLEKEAAAK